MLRALLLVVRQFLLHPALVLLIATPSARARDGMRLDQPIFHADEHLRRCADNVRIPHRQIVHIRRRVHDAKRAVYRKGVCWSAPLKTLGYLHLVDIAGNDMLATELHVL